MTKKILILGLMAMLAVGAKAQEKHGIDTLQCHIVGVDFGIMAPLWGTHSGGPDGGSMQELYESPYLNFAAEWDYKFKSNWMLSLEGDIWFGYNSDNYKDRAERMGDIFASNGLLMSWGGYNGVVTMYNRGFAVRPGVGKIIPLFRKNPDSGILLKVSGGWFMQKTIHTQDMNESYVPQLGDKMISLYDHLRNGMMFTESVGFIYMSNRNTYVNVKITFDLSECISWSSRSHVLDNLMGLNGKDENRYFDLMGAVRLSWMFPFTGKTSYDYYYY
ncbi:MAG: hypothetical protein IJ745_04785 [Bacteroidales bacterium]|nr:hypothetical protein [Bacteroidales bacterium]